MSDARERFAAVQRIFDEVIELPAAEWPAKLDALCGDDVVLRAEVESLLEADAAAPAFLDDPAADFAAPAMDRPGSSPAPVSAGETLGPWKLLREIGHGGMSVVYLAERTDGQFDKQVAVKLMRHPGGNRTEHEQRFLAERQILASLEHPNIARVLDGGMTTGGWPYLVMEYVGGKSLTSHCSAETLGVEARLELFLAVCDAVQHAHQRLVVHRDLKPSNILVSGEGAQASVKLLDFGIAKLLGEDDGSGVAATRTGLLLMTPEYAAPEQMRGGEITTATDVYALGVVLYELLTGERPFQLEGKTPGQIESEVCETEPERPSTRTTGPGPGGGDRRPNESPQRLRQLLQGDLDAIVLKALRKEPGERYGSARELAEDLRRYLGGLPVEARVPSLGYRLGKYARRNALGLGVASVFLLTLIGFTIAMAYQRGVAQQERDRAQIEADKASEVSEFVLDLFAAGDPFENRGETVTANDLLDAGVERVGELEQPETQAAMLGVMSRAYKNLGDIRRARDLAAQSLEIVRPIGDEQPRALSVALNQLAILERTLGNRDAAREMYSESVEVARAAGLEEFSGVTLMNLGHLQTLSGDYETAEATLNQSLEIHTRYLGPEDVAVADVEAKLAYLKYTRGDREAAYPHAKRAMEIGRTALGRHPRVAEFASTLAVLERRRDNLDQAETLYKEALEITREMLGVEHPKYSSLLNNYAQLLRARGDKQGAADYMQEALAITRNRVGSETRQAAGQMMNLGRALEELGRLDDAAELHYEAESVLQRLSPGTVDQARALLFVGRIERKRERHDKALEYMERAHTMYVDSQGPEHSRTLWAGLELSNERVHHKQYAQAEPLLLDAYRLFKERDGDEKRSTVNARRGLHKLYTAWGRPEEAAKWAEPEAPAGNTSENK